MRKSAKKKAAKSQGKAVKKKAAKSRVKAAKKKQTRPAKNQMQDSEAIARAVYDGMQDLRLKKSR